MPLLELPIELVLDILAEVESERDLNALCRTNKLLHSLGNERVYKIAFRHHPYIPQQVVIFNLLNAARLFCKAGREIDAARLERSLNSSLLLAVQNHNLEMVKLLLSEGADVNSRDEIGRPPLARIVLSVSEKAMPIARTLIEAGADPKEFRGWPEPPLYFAIKRGNVEMVKMLLDKGVDVMAACYRGDKPSEWVKLINGDVDPEMVRLLVEAEAKHRLDRRYY